MSAGRAKILGTGLIGTSIGLALRSRGWAVSGWDPDESALDEAVARGAFEADPGPEAEGADLVVIAAPPDAVVGILETSDHEGLITDVASVKTPIVSAGSRLRRFVGGHPMAGGETSGPAMASSSLFHGARWVLTSDGADPGDIEVLGSVISSIGANPVVMTAEEHDAAVARVSHLPHVVAAALMSLAEQGQSTLSLAGGGFRDLTRIAAADSSWWSEVLASNAAQVAASIDELSHSLQEWREKMTQGRTGELTTALDSARRARLGLGEHHTQVRVLLMDRPGEIARVGHALEKSRVDVRDFQLRHGEHGGGGVLTISVRGEGKRALVDALRDEGFEVKIDNGAG